jgi:hypothetical protein
MNKIIFAKPELAIIRAAIELVLSKSEFVLMLHKKFCVLDCGFVGQKVAEAELTHIHYLCECELKKPQSVIFYDILIEHIYKLIDFFNSNPKHFEILFDHLKLTHNYFKDELHNILNDIITRCETVPFLFLKD